MDRAEQLVDDLMNAYRENRVRLWLANFADIPDDFGEWGGLIRVSAEKYLRTWAPDRDALLERFRRRGADAADAGFDAAAQELLPLAQEGFVKDLTARKVPHKVADRARGVLLPKPPVQQWKM